MLIGMVTAIFGVIFLCQTGSGNVNIPGIAYVLLSALAYSLYMVFIKASNLKELNDDILTFYSMLFSLPVFLIPLRFGATLEVIPNYRALFFCLALAFLPSMISYWLTAVAIKYVGPTKTSVLGALEPATAVIFGVAVFNEEMNFRLAFGIFLIVASVIVVICSDQSIYGDRKNVIPEKE